MWQLDDNRYQLDAKLQVKIVKHKTFSDSCNVARALHLRFRADIPNVPSASSVERGARFISLCHLNNTFFSSYVIGSKLLQASHSFCILNTSTAFLGKHASASLRCLHIYLLHYHVSNCAYKCLVYQLLVQLS